jgi:predicted naringenin-chalcone synthase
MSLTLLGIGTSLPDHAIAQRDAATLAASFANATPGRERALEALYRKSGIHSRGSVLLDDPGDQGFVQEFFPPAEATAAGGPSTGERMARYALEAGLGDPPGHLLLHGIREPRHRHRGDR